MKSATRFCSLTCAMALLAGCAGTPVSPDMPHLEKRDGMTKLIVDGHPYICVAGELANSSSTDVQTMKAVWPRLAGMNLNTVLTVVSWDLIEPQEGKFDFSMVDYQIEAARANHLRLILLWMASWKNGLSHYPPEWVKASQDRFPRVVNAQGDTLEILSTLGTASRDADARAFAAVMRHVREVDKDHTIIGIQVENEVGVLGSARDYSPAANAAFAGPVPRELMDYLQAHKDALRPELKKVWLDAGGKTSGTWEEVFGKEVRRADVPVPNSPTRVARPPGAELLNRTDEIFMAWNYSRYMGYVAAEGKREYPLPMYVNTWIVQPNDLGPGDYPSGGPEPFVHDIWRAGGPAIDILAPDIYLPQYAQVMQNFARNGNPAFNPETRQDANNCWAAFTQLNALCFSVMGVDNPRDYIPDGAFAKTYTLVSSISGAIAEAQGRPDAIKLIALQRGQNPGKVEMGNYTFDFVTPPAGSGDTAGTPVTATAPGTSPASFINGPYVLIVRTGPDEFYFATNGNFPFRVSANVPGQSITAPASIDRGAFANGQWVTAHRLNGDDIMGLGYDLSGAAANHQAGTVIPLGSRGRWNSALASSDELTVWRVRFYHYR